MENIFTQLYRLVWTNKDTDTEVEQVAVPAGEQTAAPSDVVLGHAIHVTVEPMPVPTPEAATDLDQAEVAQASTDAASAVAPETLPPPDDTA
jgi:hypothetical protein